MPNSTALFCHFCQQEKNLSDFYFYKNGTQRYKPCKKCYQASRKKYYQEYGKKNRAKKKEYLASYHSANKERISVKKKEYREKNAAKCAETAKRYYKANQRKCNARINEYIHRVRAKKVGSAVVDRGITIESICELKGNICYLCGQPVCFDKIFPDPESPSLEHRKPFCKGGEHSFENVFVVHVRCNQKKGRKDFSICP